MPCYDTDSGIALTYRTHVFPAVECYHNIYAEPCM